jgi:hypothetical protein
MLLPGSFMPPSKPWKRPSEPLLPGGCPKGGSAGGQRYWSDRSGGSCPVFIPRNAKKTASALSAFRVFEKIGVQSFMA